MSIKNSTETEKILTDGKSLGKRLRALRKRAGLSQGELAEQLGYKAPASISNAEADKTPLDSDTLAKIAPLLNADVHWLLTGQPAPTAQEAANQRQDAINKLARYVSSEVARLLKNRDEIAAELKDVEQRKSAGESVEAVLIDVWKTQLLVAECRLQEVGKDQDWVRLALADTVGNRTE